MSESSTIKLLQEARARYSQHELADMLGVDARTVRRWEVRDHEPPAYLADALRQKVLPLAPDTPATPPAFTFIDLFAGIGGIRLGFESIGGQCLFTSEWNPFSQKTYLANFPPHRQHQLAGDITNVTEQDIPDHDVLLAGFPCQPFSIAGVSKKNAMGRPHGFACNTQGTLFFDVARIIAAKRPAAFLLENVKNLLSHDKGNTFKVILETLKDELGYDVHFKVIDGKHFVPQHRERIMIVGFRKPTAFAWNQVELPAISARLGDILHPQNGSEAAEPPYTDGSKAAINAKYTLSEKLWNYLQAYAEKHRAAGNGFGFGLVNEESITRTLSARYYKDGSEILVSQGKRKRPRKLTPRECARLMGYPDTFKIPVSDTQAYKQFGNSVVVPVIGAVAKAMLPYIRELTTRPARKKSKAAAVAAEA
jgi:DNA (cytosine-5)-methyltransferase 1